MLRPYFIICALLIGMNVINISIANAKHLELSELNWETSSLLSPTYFIENGYNCFAYNLEKEQQVEAHQCETQGILGSERLWVFHRLSSNNFTVVRCKVTSDCNATHLEILNKISDVLVVE